MTVRTCVRTVGTSVSFRKARKLVRWLVAAGLSTLPAGLTGCDVLSGGAPQFTASDVTAVQGGGAKIELLGRFGKHGDP